MEARGAARRPALVRSAAVAAILAVFVLVRLPLLTRDAAARGWNGDSAIFGLMAKKIHDGKGLDVFFWGQNYQGPLTAALAAGIRRAVLDPAGTGDAAGPLALRLAAMAEIAFGIGVFVFSLARLFGLAIAVAAGLWMALGPPFFVRLSALNRSGLGPEMAFALGSVLFLLATDALTARDPVLERPAGRFAFGLVAGLGWWMNETIVFVLAPAAAVALWRASRRGFRSQAPLLLGAALGYAPVWLGRLLGWYEIHLGTVVPSWRLSGLPGRFPTLLSTGFWRFVGLDGVLPAPLLAVLALLVLALLALRRPRSGPLVFVGAVAGLAVGVQFLKDLDPLRDRYLAVALPAALSLVLVAVAEAASRLRHRLPARVVALAVAGLAVAGAAVLARRARDTVDALAHEPDPRSPLRAIESEGYTVCHAGYDTAYTLQFLSDERVRFVPYHGPDRNRALSAELRALPGPQCLVGGDGSVRRWLPSDEATEGGPARRRADAATRYPPTRP